MNERPSKEQVDEAIDGLCLHSNLDCPISHNVGKYGRILSAEIDALTEERDAAQAQNEQLRIACASMAGLRIAYGDADGVSCDDFAMLLQVAAKQASKALEQAKEASDE